MMERLLEQRWAISAVLHDDTVTQSRYSSVKTNGNYMSRCWQFFKHLQLATTALCKPELSLVYPVINGLLNKHLVVTTDDQQPVKAFKQVVSQEIKCRFIQIVLK